MKKTWFKDLNEDETRELKVQFNASAVVFQRLEELIDAKLKESSKESISKAGYDCPNWAYKQADVVGYQRALAEIKSLLK